MDRLGRIGHMLNSFLSRLEKIGKICDTKRVDVGILVRYRGFLAVGLVAASVVGVSRGVVVLAIVER